MTVHPGVSTYTSVTSGQIESCWFESYRLGNLDEFLPRSVVLDIDQGSITFDIITKLYNFGASSNEASRITEVANLEYELIKWTDDLPDFLSLSSEDALRKAPSYMLSLHIQRECAVIALQYPSYVYFIISRNPVDLTSLLPV